MIGRAPRLRGERGSAVVEFTLVSVVLVAVFLAVLQFGFVIHVRNTLVACAAEGARHAANADRGLAEGEARTAALIGSALSPSLAGEVRSRTVSVNGVQMVEITVTTTLPLFGLLGVDRGLTVVGHAVEESAL
ncbi:MAG TPA: TadE family protein [Jiangellaceae bacterium]|nr:TadE family protein [Jiangellaceae bacterium]